MKGEYPRRAEQLCLLSSQEFSELKGVLLKRAGRGLQFIDGSARSEENLRSVGANNVLRTSAPIISLSLLRRGDGITVSNLGLPPNQVIVAEYPISGDEEVTRSILREIQRRWKTVPLAAGTDAKPLKGCPVRDIR